MADGLAGKDVATLDEILHILRDAYCRTMGVEYMHIQDPAQKSWIQQHVEGVPIASLGPDEQRHILGRLNAAEVFERFLHSRYVGQKRFGLEGAESAIVLLDTILEEAVDARAWPRRSWAWPTAAASTCWPTSWASPTARSSRSSRETSIPNPCRAPVT